VVSERIRILIDDMKESLEIAKNMVNMGYNTFIRDVRNRYTLRLALVEIVEAAASLGLYLLREILGVKRIEGYSHIFRKLVEHGIISPEVGEEMGKLTKLRNLIIHKYWEVDDTRIYREARDGGLSMVERFIKEVEKYVS